MARTFQILLLLAAIISIASSNFQTTDLFVIETTDELSSTTDDDHDHDHDSTMSTHDSHDHMTSDTDDSHDHEHDHSHDDSHDDDDHDEHEHDHGDEQNVGLAFAITFAAGFAACLGATSIFCVKPEQLAVIPAALGFSSGVVVYLSFMNLIPECIELLYESSGEESESLAHFYSLLCVIGGIVLAFLSERCFHHHHGEEDEFDSNGHVADASDHVHAIEESKSDGQTNNGLEEATDEIG